MNYLQFERIPLALIIVLITIVAAYAIVVAVMKLVSDMLLGEAFLDKAALQDTFGQFLTILILLEFNHSVYVALTNRSGALQARMLVLITIMVIARKLMLMDFTAIEAQTMLGFGGLLLALGALYWLLSSSDHNRREASAPAPGGTASLDRPS